mmetsp:Transcript_9876/g.36818  ORF Transcript_9876/g.36818 Transcript_9876/m.36818 type:complete len:954 (-) Transcript_9876:6472-9333(-)
MEQISLMEWNQLGRIECLAHYENVLFIGSSDGHLFQFGLGANGAPSESGSLANARTTSSPCGSHAHSSNDSFFSFAESEPRQLSKVKLSKNAIAHIEIDSQRHLMFLLVDGSVSMFALEKQRTSAAHAVSNVSWNFKLNFICVLKETKGCSGFALNLGDAYDSFRGRIVCVIKKRSLTLLKYWKDGEASMGVARAEYQREFKLPLPEQIQNVVWVNQYIFLALKTISVAISSSTGQQDNSMLSSLSLHNLIADDKTKYLPASKILGPFVHPQGEFPTETTLFMEFCFPFLVSCSAKHVEVFNLYEQSVINKYKLASRPVLTYCDPTHIILVLKGRVMVYEPPSIGTQIRSMINDNRILQAFGMFEKTFRGSEEDKMNAIAHYKEEAGFACFFRTRYKEAFNYFSESNIDIRDIIYYFSDLTPDSFIHQPSTVKGDLKKKIKETILSRGQDPSDARVAIRLKQAKKSLLQYLEKMRRVDVDPSKQHELKAQQAIDYALCYLYLKEVKNYGELKQLLRHDNNCVFEDVAPLFDNNAVFQAFLCWSKDKRQDALNILRDVGDGKLLEDSTKTNGVQETVELLVESNDHNLIFMYAPHAFEIDDTVAVNMFTNTAVTADPDRVVEFLSLLPSDIQRTYLEFLIFEKKNEEERYHNELIFNYIKSIEVLKPPVYLPHGVRVIAGMEGGTLGQLRSNLLTLLSGEQTFYNSSKVLRRLQSTSLYEEMIVLFRASDNHQASLKLLVHNIEDFEWAERYCIEVHEEEKEGLREQIAQNPSTQLEERLTKLDHNPYFLILLDICFHSQPRNEQLGVFLLKNHAKEIDPIACLGIIPDKMTLSELLVYLRQSVQHTYDREKQSELIYNLQNMNHIQHESLLARGLSRRVIIKENSMCPVCSKAIGSSSVVAIFPSQQMPVLHLKCCNKKTLHKHPITGRDFCVFEQPIRVSETAVLQPKPTLL